MILPNTSGNSAPPLVNPSLQPFLVPVENLHEDERNARRHGPRNLQATAKSLRQLGQQKPIVVDGSGKIVAGNGTYRAATQILGWTHIAAVVFDGDRKKARQFALADNRTAELAEWDFQALSGMVKEILDDAEEVIGWEDHEIEPLVQAVWDKPAADASEHFEAAPTHSDATDATEATTGTPAAAAGSGQVAPLGRGPADSPLKAGLFDQLTQDQQVIVLHALQAVRDAATGALTNEEALVAVCQAYLGSLQAAA